MPLIPNKYNMIVAADLNWCIGKENNLLTHIPEDLKIFKAITSNKIVIMGKKTQESLPNHTFLKNRVNIVLSRKTLHNTIEHCEKTIVVNESSITNIPSFIKSFNRIYINNPEICDYNYLTDGDVFVIGGGQIYNQFLENDLIDTIYLTRIHHEYNGDTFIPNLYDLGFKTIDTIVPESVSQNGTKYDISILKKSNI